MNSNPLCPAGCRQRCRNESRRWRPTTYGSAHRHDDWRAALDKLAELPAGGYCCCYGCLATNDSRHFDFEPWHRHVQSYHHNRCRDAFENHRESYIYVRGDLPATQRTTYTADILFVKLSLSYRISGTLHAVAMSAFPLEVEAACEAITRPKCHKSAENVIKNWPSWSEICWVDDRRSATHSLVIGRPLFCDRRCACLEQATVTPPSDAVCWHF